MSQPTSIVLVDDHVIVRNGIKSLIEVIGNYKVIGQFDNGLQFINAVPTLNEPYLAIIDLNMPEMDGVETMRWLRKNKPDIKALILTLESDERTIIELFRLGIRGYLPKSCSAEVLKAAIDDVSGTGYYHNEILQYALTADPAQHKDDKDVRGMLTERELQFLQLVCDSKEYTYDEIADMMKLSLRTVDGYRDALFRKFSLKSKIGLVLFAIKHDLVKV